MRASSVEKKKNPKTQTSSYFWLSERTVRISETNGNIRYRWMLKSPYTGAENALVGVIFDFTWFSCIKIHKEGASTSPEDNLQSNLCTRMTKVVQLWQKSPSYPPLNWLNPGRIIMQRFACCECDVISSGNRFESLIFQAGHKHPVSLAIRPWGRSTFVSLSLITDLNVVFSTSACHKATLKFSLGLWAA